MELSSGNKRVILTLVLLFGVFSCFAFAASPLQVVGDTFKTEATGWGLGLGIFIVAIVVGFMCIREGSLRPLIWGAIGTAVAAMGPNLGTAIQTYYGALAF